jgi:hypothetical protein
MHWTRRRPKWPYSVALGLLLTLTFIAPWAWRHSRAAKPKAPPGPSPHVVKKSLPSAATGDKARATEAAAFEAAPALPPLAAGREPMLAGPMVEADDYVAVDEPLMPSPLTPMASATKESCMHRPASPAPEELAQEPVDEPPGPNASVAPTPSLPTAFTVESLAKVRQAIMAAVEQAREAHAQATSQQAITATPIAASSSVTFSSPPQVKVESEHDRLAMIPYRTASAAPEVAPQPTPASQAAAPVTAEPSRPVITPQAPLRHRPTALMAQLEALSGRAGEAWAEQVLASLDELTRETADTTRDWTPTVQELRRLSEQGFSDALMVKDAAEQTAWIRADRALDRRLPVWALLLDRQLMTQGPNPGRSPDDNAGLIQAIENVTALTSKAPEGNSWRAYLRLDDLAGLTSVGGDDHAEARRAAARDVLIRMSDPWLTRPQQEFIAKAEVVALGEELRPWATGEASLDTLAAFVERFESTNSLRDADAIAELRLRMKWSADERLQALAEELNRNYRNANVRVAFSGELMNRMIPPQTPVEAPVRSHIAGTDVRGRSLTETEIKVRLLPDPKVWRLGLEVHGQVNTRTVSQTWPARVCNCSRADYEARKLVLINRFGLHVYPAEAHAEGDTSLVGVDSSLSPVPIIGAIVENAAREQSRQSRSQAVAEMRAKIEREACGRMDAEAGEKLVRLEQRVQEKVLTPLARLGLRPEPIDMNTSDQRATMRLRLAGEQQLAAYTPRPSAPSDSLASVQLHESVFNNAAQGLGLDGRRMTAPELYAVLTNKLRRPPDKEPDDLPRAAKVEFAAHDAVRIMCREDRIELILNIVELRHGRDSIRGVGVHAFFRPVVDGLDIKLVRDGTLQFDGAHLRTGPRVVLHSVFGKLLPKDQEIPLLMAKLAEDPRFAGLMVTQLVIDDGWVAMSVGPTLPNRTAWRTRGAEMR